MYNTKVCRIDAKLKVYYKTINAWMDPDIAEYYRSMIPKYYYVKPPKNPTHISVVRPFEGYTTNNWKRFDGAIVEVWYEPIVQTNGLYFWLNAWSEDILEIRNALGLPNYIGPYKSYHITVGNTK